MAGDWFETTALFGSAIPLPSTAFLAQLGLEGAADPLTAYADLLYERTRGVQPRPCVHVMCDAVQRERAPTMDSLRFSFQGVRIVVGTGSVAYALNETRAMARVAELFAADGLLEGGGTLEAPRLWSAIKLS